MTPSTLASPADDLPPELPSTARCLHCGTNFKLRPPQSCFSNCPYCGTAFDRYYLSLGLLEAQ